MCRRELRDGDRGRHYGGLALQAFVMKYPTHPTIRPKRHTASAVLVGLAMFAILAAYAPPVAHAGDPPDDCWGGALSADPLHCYVLDQAHSAGVIDLDALYEGNGILYVYLAQTEPVGDEVGAFFKEKAPEFVERWPDRVHRDHQVYEGCVVLENTTYEDCMLNLVTPWEGDLILPFPASYVRIVLRTGGAEARKSVPGWGAYRQLWPEATNAFRRAASASSGRFDVSGIDTGNIPPIDCSRPPAYTHGYSCGEAVHHPGLGIAGWQITENGSKWYIQVKAPPGQEANIATAREALRAFYYLDPDETFLELIPVKYSYEDLWRWGTIINRFALTSGNTLGTTTARIGMNSAGEVAGEVVYPLESLPEVDAQALQEHRSTIHVWTMDRQPTVDALPGLLSQLNIPVDAVGVVVSKFELSVSAWGPEGGADLSRSTSSKTQGSTAEAMTKEWTADWVWLTAGVGGLFVVVTLGSAALRAPSPGFPSPAADGRGTGPASPGWYAPSPWVNGERR